MSVKLKGTVKWFDTTKGFGFLLVDDSKGDVLLHANDIFWQAAASHAMPPGQVIWIEDEERAMLAAWRNMINHGLVDRGS